MLAELLDLKLKLLVELEVGQYRPHTPCQVLALRWPEQQCLVFLSWHWQQKWKEREYPQLRMVWRASQTSPWVSLSPWPSQNHDLSELHAEGLVGSSKSLM